MTEQFQDLRLFHVQHLSLSADVDVGLEFNLLEVELGGETKLAQMRLHAVAEALKCLSALRQVHGEGGGLARDRKVFHLLCLETLLKLRHRLVAEQHADLPVQVSVKQVGIIGVFIFGGTAECHAHHLVFAEEKLAVRVHAVRQALEGAGPHVFERNNVGVFVCLKRFLNVGDKAFLGGSTLLFNLGKMHDLVSLGLGHYFILIIIDNY